MRYGTVCAWWTTLCTALCRPRQLRLQTCVGRQAITYPLLLVKRVVEPDFDLSDDTVVQSHVPLRWEEVSAGYHMPLIHCETQSPHLCRVRHRRKGTHHDEIAGLTESCMAQTGSLARRNLT